jgi:hypothetical protein
VSSHWVLLEIRWVPKQLHIYDSLPERTTALNDNENIKSQTRTLFQLLRDVFKSPEAGIEGWTWFSEQVSFQNLLLSVHRLTVLNTL